MKEWLLIDLLVSVGIYTSSWEGGTFGPRALMSSAVLETDNRATDRTHTTQQCCDHPYMGQ